MKIAIGADHAGLFYKSAIIKYIEDNSWDFIDFGAHDSSSVDYPKYASVVCKCILEGEVDLGVLICGSGIGMSIAANRYNNIRAALCHTALEARLARQHNNANVLCLGERIIGISHALDCFSEFIKTDFEGGRHKLRVDMIENMS